MVIAFLYHPEAVGMIPKTTGVFTVCVCLCVRAFVYVLFFCLRICLCPCLFIRSVCTYVHDLCVCAVCVSVCVCSLCVLVAKQKVAAITMMAAAHLSWHTFVWNQTSVVHQ